MTTIITRLFPDQASAQKAAERLHFKGVPRREIDVIAGAEDADARMSAAQVHETARAAYAKGLAAGNAVLVARTTYRPLGVARITRETLDQRGVIDVGDVMDDFFVRSGPEPRLSVMREHPHMLSLPGFQARGLVSEAFGLSLLKPHRTKRSATKHNRPMSRMFWPMPLLSRKTRRNKVMSGTRHMSRAFWPMKLISTAPRRKSVIPGGGFPLSRRMGMRLTSLS